MECLTGRAQISSGTPAPVYDVPGDWNQGLALRPIILADCERLVSLHGNFFFVTCAPAAYSPAQSVDR